MAYHDAGLADSNWKRFYTPEEVEEVVGATSTTMFVSGTYPIHARLYECSVESPTIIMSHPMLPYGLLLARLQLPFYRAGFNVVQWDLPGWGQSGGPRANCPIPDFIQAWKDAIAFTGTRFTGPRYAMGLAEDSVTCYYVGANNPDLRAISLHTLHEYGDPDGVHWHGPSWLVQLKAIGVRLGTLVRPDLALRATDALPWRAIFSGPDDGAFLQAFEDDPLRVRRFHFRLVGSMMGRVPPPVPFEQCHTPVQVIASEKSSLWPHEMSGVDQWVYTREFHEEYAAHVIRWFTAHGAEVPPPAAAALAQ